MNIFSKAAQGLPLTPAQRAFLKLLKGWLYTALGVGIIAGSQYIMGTALIDWQKLGYIVGTGVLLSVLHALDKYFTAQGDTSLALVTEAVEQKIPAQPTPAQQKAPQPILLPGVTMPPNTTTSINPSMPQNMNVSAIQQPVQQVPFPPVQPLQFPARNPQQIPAINLADVPPAQDNTQRHFGDSQIMPVVPSNQQ